MRHRLTLGLALLRAAALLAVLVLLINPTWSRPVPTSAPPLVLLDASLSMTAPSGPWRAALDSARRLAAGGPIWRFGGDAGVAPFDTGAPDEGMTRLGPGLAAAAARGGPVVVVTDGAIADAAELPADLRRRPRVIVLPRAQRFDAYVAEVDGPRHVVRGDTIQLRVAYGAAGRREGRKEITLTVSTEGRRLSSQGVTLPDSGVVVREVRLPASLLPVAGYHALEVRLDGAGDSEPRDDARLFVVEVGAQPTAVVLAAPPDWEARFFARTLADVARVPVRLYARTEPGRWRDGATLAPVTADDLTRAVAQARVVALIGDPAALVRFRRRAGIVTWPLAAARPGDWYVDPPPASALAASLAGLAWDSLPPAAGLADVTVDSAGIVLLTARLGRRGSPRPLVLLRDSAGSRSVTVAGTGLWRWGFRGGAPAEAYRTLVAALADWLLADNAAGSRERFGPATPEAPHGVALEWRWTNGAPPPATVVQLGTAGRSRIDTLRFDASGQASLRLPPGIYSWRSADGPERGLVAVEEYSAEWRPAAVTLGPQPGEAGGARRDVAARDQWWLYVLALAAFVAEWVWRRRQGLP